MSEGRKEDVVGKSRILQYNVPVVDEEILDMHEVIKEFDEEGNSEEEWSVFKPEINLKEWGIERLQKWFIERMHDPKYPPNAQLMAAKLFGETIGAFEGVSAVATDDNTFELDGEPV